MMNPFSMIKRRLSLNDSRVPSELRRRNKKSADFTFELEGEIINLDFRYNWKNRRYTVDLNGEIQLDMSEKEGETIKNFLYLILRH